MVDNIRRIGMFMIVAQTVIHFAAGSRYEKYMKVITGIIVLAMFIGPPASSSGVQIVDWEEQMGRLEQQMREQRELYEETTGTAGTLETAALRQIEEEVKTRLNDAIADDGGRVTHVSIALEETGKDEDGKVRDWVFRRVEVTVEQGREEPAEGSAAEPIRIDPIRVGNDADGQKESGGVEQDARIRAYRTAFAQSLGITEDRVEVTELGGG